MTFSSPAPATWVVELLDQIARLGQAGQSEEAIALCQQLLQQSPETAAAYHFWGLAELQQGRAAEALSHFQQAIALDPTIADFHNHAGVAQFQLTQVEAGIASYQRAVALRPDRADFRYNLALGLQRSQHTDKAIQHYRLLLVHHPDHAEAQAELAQLLAQSPAPETATEPSPSSRSVAPSRQSPEVPDAIAPDSLGAITCRADAGFQEWLRQSGGSILLSTYQANQLVWIGWNGQQMTVLPRSLPKPMGIAYQGDRLALTTRHAIVFYANAAGLVAPNSSASSQPYDALFLPRTTYHTGDLNSHDLVFGEDGLWCVNTRFSTLSRLSHDFSFIPQWHPPFISALLPEDRCHLNGLALVNGQPAYVTALGATDSPGGWRDRKADGGLLMALPSGERLLEGLSMPHSPRWWGDRLWFLNSGTGDLCQFNPATREVAIACTLPGFGRGLALVGNYALVGLSQIREKHIFGDLPIQQRYPKLMCGVAIVALERGEPIGLLQFTEGCQELFAVEFIPRYQRPTLLLPDHPDSLKAFTSPEMAYWIGE